MVFCLRGVQALQKAAKQLKEIDSAMTYYTRRRKRAKRRQYELRRLRRLAKTKPRKKSYHNSLHVQSKIISGGITSHEERTPFFQLTAPSDFRLLKNTEGCISFFKKLRSRDYAYKSEDGILRLLIDLRYVQHIDFASTMLLESICDELEKTKPICLIYGNAPVRSSCRQYLKDSGFLNNKVDMTGRPYELSTTSENMKIAKGNEKLKDDQIKKFADMEKRIYKHISGCDGQEYKRIEIIKEICGNTVDWSKAEHDQWSFGMKFEEDKVIVVALDLGQGILESISRNFTEYIKDMLDNNSHVDILEGAFNRKYGSKSKQTYRNRGLPSIKHANTLGHIKDLIVLTNNVILDFTTSEKSRKFANHRNRAFSGTLYSWIVDSSCIKSK